MDARFSQRSIARIDELVGHASRASLEPKGLAQRRKLMNSTKKMYIVTGGSSGIGYHLVKRLREASRVVALARSAEQTDLVDNSVVFGINTDVRSLQQLLHAKEKMKNAFQIGQIDGLINCAGIGYRQPLLELTEQDYEDVFATNVKGLMFATKTFMDLLKDHTGIICNISSIAGIKGFSEWSLYSASKFAVEGFTQSIRHELRPRGIRVMCVRPGSVDTPIYEHLSIEEKRDFIDPATIAHIIFALLDIPQKAVVEDIFINNSVGDL
jgi:NAD(P)-dependent dehydrogenase (short-subunit alcohol dehydrogenase family)